MSAGEFVAMVGRVGDKRPLDGHGILLHPRPMFRCAFTATDPGGEGWSFDELCMRPAEFRAATVAEHRSTGIRTVMVCLCAEHAAHAVACPYCASGVDRVTPVA